MIISYIIDVDQCGFSPTYVAIHDMADKLLAARDAGQVGQKWPANFVKRTDSLTTLLIERTIGSELCVRI